MLLAQQVQALVYHFLGGVCFGILFSFLSLCEIHRKTLTRIVMTCGFSLVFTCFFFYGLYFINGGVTQIYCIILFALGFYLFYAYVYCLFIPLYIRILRLFHPIVHSMRVAKKKMYGIIAIRVGLNKGGQEMDKKDPNANKMKKKKLLIRLKNIVLITFSCIFIYNVGNEIMTTKELNQNLAQAQALASEIESEKSALEEEKEKLQNPEYVKRFARGKLLVTQDGEQVFSLEPNTEE